MKLVFELVEQWVGPFQAVVLVFLGLLLGVFVITFYWDNRLNALSAFAGLVACWGVILHWTDFDIFQTGNFVQRGLELLILPFAVTWLISIFSKRKDVNLDLIICRRALGSSSLIVFFVIIFSVSAVTLVGLSAPQALVGDEVTHYYMLVRQSQDLSQPNFYAEIPVSYGDPEVRRYPHSFVWHYAGALLFRLTNGAFTSVQLYQSFFLLQLLGVSCLLARSRNRENSMASLLYIVVLSSLPLSLFFSVTFYQDIPMTAQAVTAFYLLHRRHWFFASLFMLLAIGIKISALLFLPAFFFLCLFRQLSRTHWKNALIALTCSSFIIFSGVWGLGYSVKTYGESKFYPQEQLESIVSGIKAKFRAHLDQNEKPSANQKSNKKVLDQKDRPKSNLVENRPPVIANHPGDLRIRSNFLIFGGCVFWLVILCGSLGRFFYRRSGSMTQESSTWLFGVGVSYLLLTAYLVRSSPDARFFLPGLPFILLPFAEWAVRLPKRKYLISVIVALALFQGGYVLAKAFKLRVVSESTTEAIHFLAKNPLSPRTLFMYPEGSYRLFPAPHEWYLGYRLREFWRSDNDHRISMMEDFDVGAIVIKKHLISQVDTKITNLGVYPDYFVKEISTDPRFEMVFDNNQISIYLLPYTRVDQK